MIYSKKLRLKEVSVRMEDDGHVTIIWNCPFCNKKVEGRVCSCHAYASGVMIFKEFDKRPPDRKGMRMEEADGKNSEDSET